MPWKEYRAPAGLLIVMSMLVGVWFALGVMVNHRKPGLASIDGHHSTRSMVRAVYPPVHVQVPRASIFSPQ